MKNDLTIYLLAMRVRVSNRDVLEDIDFVVGIIDRVVELADMTIVVPALTVRLPVRNYIDLRGRVPDQNDKGLSAICVIAESHVSVHTWTDLGLCYIELSSCREFDRVKLYDGLGAYFRDYCGGDIELEDMRYISL